MVASISEQGPSPLIFVDDRVGSIDLMPILQSHRSHPAVQSTRLNAGDFCFSGQGERGPCMIGIERKRVARGFDRQDGMQFRDMLGSIRTGRFSGEQLPKLLDQYEYVFLIVEGVLRTERDTGHLKQLRGREWETVLLGRTPFLADELYSFLSSISLHAGVEVIQTSDQYETTEHIVRLEKYFSKPWDRHRAHRALHTPQGPYVTLGKASTVRRVANALTGIGWERSATVEGRFKTVVDMANAEEGEWRKLDGFGKKRSRQVWEELRGMYEAGDGIE